MSDMIITHPVGIFNMSDMIITHPVGSNANITSPFGFRVITAGFHVGIDFGGGKDGTTPLYAVEDSIVVKELVIPNLKYPNVLLRDSNGKPIKTPEGELQIDPKLKGIAVTSRLTLQGIYTKNKYVYKHLYIAENILDPWRKNNNSLNNIVIKIKSGDQVGLAGNFGFSDGVHLHFEMPLPVTPIGNSRTITTFGNKPINYIDPEIWLKENVNFYSNIKTFTTPIKSEVTNNSNIGPNSNISKKFEIDTGSFSNLVDIVTLKGII